MKNHLLHFTAFLLVLSGVASSCNPEPEPNLVNRYPIDLPFTEYILLETSCQWVNLPNDDKVLIINSSEELGKYISCAEGSYPAIDFSKHSLLLACGTTPHEIGEVTARRLQQMSSSTYKLSIDIALKITQSVAQYSLALLVEKIDQKSMVAMNVTLMEAKIIHPVTVTDYDLVAFFDWALPRTEPTATASQCFFTTMGHENTCIMINSREEFQQACVCTDDLPEIDFNAYTLIVGQTYLLISKFILEHWIVEDNLLTLHLLIHGSGGPQESQTKYYWGIYPKLPKKLFDVELKYVFK